jgi:hypothetical protein
MINASYRLMRSVLAGDAQGERRSDSRRAAPRDKKVRRVCRQGIERGDIPGNLSRCPALTEVLQISYVVHRLNPFFALATTLPPVGGHFPGHPLANVTPEMSRCTQEIRWKLHSR